MNPLKSIMKPALRLLPWLGLAALTGCSMDDDLGDCTSGTSALQVTVSARQEGDLNARATEEGQDGEFMHDLCVLFVQGNVVKLKLQPDLSSDPSAQKGNLQAWTSGEQNGLEAGKYTVYAFANISDHYGKWIEGVTLSGDALPESIVIEDPAGNLDFKNGKFIPMSAKKEITITAATRSVSIGLDRLVSKVRMRIGTTSQDPVTVKNVTFSGYADKVSLIQDVELSNVSRDMTKEVISQPFTLSNGTTRKFEDFYVNETQEGAPFTISVTTDEHEGVTYLATTERTELPRNNIYPVELNLNEGELNVSIEVYLLAIGVSVEDCKMELINGVQGTYRLRIPYGGLFHLTLANTDGITYDPTGCHWENDPGNTLLALRQDLVEGSSEDLPESQGSIPGTTVWGYNSAKESQIGNEYPVYLTARWSDSRRTYNRRYTILIAPEEWDNFEYSILNTNSRESRSLYLNKEYLNMFIKK